MKCKMLILLTVLLAVGGLRAHANSDSDSQAILAANTLYNLNSANCPDKNLDLNKNKLGDQVQLWEKNFTSAQHFYLIKHNDDIYEIKKADYDLNLHIIPDPSQEDNQVRIGGEISGNTGEWKLVKASKEDQLFYVVSANNGKALTGLKDADYPESIRAKKFTGEISQQWRFLPIK